MALMDDARDLVDSPTRNLWSSAATRWLMYSEVTGAGAARLTETV